MLSLAAVLMSGCSSKYGTKARFGSERSESMGEFDQIRRIAEDVYQSLGSG